MANTYCYRGYCEYENEDNKVKLTNRFLVIGGILAIVALSALVLYSASQGVYVDPVMLP